MTATPPQQSREGEQNQGLHRMLRGLYDWVMRLAVQVSPHHFQSEVRHAVEQALGTGPGGFFEPGRLRFGEDLRASDIVQALMALDGVEHVCLNRFKRLGDRFADQAASGRIALEGLEVVFILEDEAVVEYMQFGDRKSISG